ncbi:class I glutamine amidotransferase-like protein [Aaosphaeria arxii CBS 175.79]|uniref:Class I glutamine amidotransferase-like protein n=1 Tax=Aaosphaeria arxii CBS 175.79 TaxID=1450172 RepID=A0A6A5Y504_9PLEO|nr:class I glutamine amidotransferase-like protein [Aaosphaeria arxii CBS 175.79]KAF2020293.1 class I glutamine amidotransferase-like protein [Aaosphaeria arxii CBS 175.79]
MAPLRIGVLIVPPIQLLDISPIDLLAMLKRSYFEACNRPAELVAQAIPDEDLQITYISLSGPSTSASTTAALDLKVDAGLDDPSVAPGKLDILLIPGPPPGLRPEEEVLDFVRAHVESGVELLTICTGVFVAAFAGVLNGKRATGTRGVKGLLEESFKEVKWEDKRYVNDGKIWTSGGITNGMDMMAVYLRQRWPGTLSEIVLSQADVEPRPADYGS